MLSSGGRAFGSRDGMRTETIGAGNRVEDCPTLLFETRRRVRIAVMPPVSLVLVRRVPSPTRTMMVQIRNATIEDER